MLGNHGEVFLPNSHGNEKERKQWQRIHQQAMDIGTGWYGKEARRTTRRQRPGRSATPTPAGSWIRKVMGPHSRVYGKKSKTDGVASAIPFLLAALPPMHLLRRKTSLPPSITDIEKAVFTKTELISDPRGSELQNLGPILLLHQCTLSGYNFYEITYGKSINVFDATITVHNICYCKIAIDW